MKRGQFIYDGWIPNEEWTRSRLEQIVSMLDDFVNVFSIVGKYYAYWEPKYYYSNDPIPSHLISPPEFLSLSKTIGIIERLPEADRSAISRSAAWIANALRSESRVQRFLLLFVSIESLVTYIERESQKDSPLREFAADKLPKSEKRLRREACIQEIMDSKLDLTKAVQEAYFKCVVGNRKMLEDHLNRAFGNDEASRVMFVERVGEKTLWEVRNDIAHGSLNVLSEEEIRVASSRIGLLEEIARRYLRTILSRIARVHYFPKTRRPIITIPASGAIGAPGTQYIGPTDMAEYYANVEVLSSSYMRVTF